MDSLVGRFLEGLGAPMSVPRRVPLKTPSPLKFLKVLHVFFTVWGNGLEIVFRLPASGRWLWLLHSWERFLR